LKNISRARVHRDDRAIPIVVLPVVEEQARVATRVVETGRVRVRKIVRERVAELDAALRRDDVVVERVPMDRLVAEPPPARHEGDVLVIAAAA
jgi:stress response protein YsnF